MPPNYYGRGGFGIAEDGVASSTAAAPEGRLGHGCGAAASAGEHSAAGRDDSADSDAGTSPETKKKDSGCAVSAPGANGTGMLGFLGMLGLSVLALRRRK